MPFTISIWILNKKFNVLVYRFILRIVQNPTNVMRPVPVFVVFPGYYPEIRMESSLSLLKSTLPFTLAVVKEPFYNN